MTHVTRAGHAAVLVAVSVFAGGAQEGIPVDDALTIQKCGGCHKVDERNMMGRISFMRTTPEVWQEIIKRMVRLNGVTATPAEVRDIVRYLSNNNGLAPEELKPAFWEVEHRQSGHQSDHAPQALQRTCNYCHTIGRVLLQRRTRDDYEKLLSMHVGLFPGAENVFRPRQIASNAAETPIRLVAGTTGSGKPSLEPPPPPVDMKAEPPGDVALEYLATAQPLITAEWMAWKAAMHTPKLTGSWAVSGYQTGKGKVYGLFTVTPGANVGEFTTKVELHYATTGASLVRSGKGIVYTGYSWRGRQTSNEKAGSSSDPGTNPVEWRETMMVSRDGNSMSGRWFWGGYDEFGIDVALARIRKEPVVLGTDLFALRSPSTREVRVFGANFAANVKAEDIDFGQGIAVKRLLTTASDMLTVELEVSPGLLPGMRDVMVAGATATKAIAVYDKVGYLKVAPSGGMARLGGTMSPKQFMQFEAIAFSNGPDGKSNTEDDVALGPVFASWSLDEFYSTPDDDDIKYVGSINDSGLFTPNIEGPNPDRKKSSNNFPTNNWGDVWVNAAYREDDRALRARSYLVVTIPMYVRYDQPEVSK